MKEYIKDFDENADPHDQEDLNYRVYSFIGKNVRFFMHQLSC